MKFINTLVITIRGLDLKISKIMKNGFKVSLILMLFSCYILIAYHLANIPNLFYMGISLFKTSLSFGVAFFIFGISFNKIKKEII